MEINDANRRHFMLTNEAQVIQNAASATPGTACEVARACVDGIVNGMLRLEGPKPTSEFLFRLADRAAGDLLKPTEIKPPARGEPIDFGAIRIKAPQWWERLTYATGFVQGAWVVILVLVVMGRLK
jgi:hypothetical protein